MFDQRAAAPFDESLVPAHARAPAACENECVHLDLSPSLRKDFSVVPAGLDGLRYPLPSTSCWANFHRPFGTSWFLNPRPALRAGLFFSRPCGTSWSPASVTQHFVLGYFSVVPSGLHGF